MEPRESATQDAAALSALMLVSMKMRNLLEIVALDTTVPVHYRQEAQECTALWRDVAGKLLPSRSFVPLELPTPVIVLLTPEELAEPVALPPAEPEPAATVSEPTVVPVPAPKVKKAVRFEELLRLLNRYGRRSTQYLATDMGLAYVTVRDLLLTGPFVRLPQKLIMGRPSYLWGAERVSSLWTEHDTLQYGEPKFERKVQIA